MLLSTAAHKPKFGVMKLVAVSILCVVLLGCPAQERVYVHNKSSHVLTHTYDTINRDPVVVKPGQTKHFYRSYDRTACVTLDVDGLEKNYLFSERVLGASRSTGYGSRIDVYFEYERLFVEHPQDGWLEIAEVSKCDDI